jgi:hypothetical protein
MTGGALRARTIDLAECPSIDTLMNKARCAVGSAILADHSRSRPLAEPFERKGVISCRAALFNFGVACTRFGGPVEMTPFSRAAERDRRACTIFPNGGCTEGNELFASITGRHTSRTCQTLEPVPRPDATPGHQAPYWPQTAEARMSPSPPLMGRPGGGATVPHAPRRPLEDVLS